MPGDKDFGKTIENKTDKETREELMEKGVRPSLIDMDRQVQDDLKVLIDHEFISNTRSISFLEGEIKDPYRKKTEFGDMGNYLPNAIINYEKFSKNEFGKITTILEGYYPEDYGVCAALLKKEYLALIRNRLKVLKEEENQ